MPRTFTNLEYADMHFIYGFCDGSAQAAADEYHRRFPNRRIPSRQVFIDVHRRFRLFGLKKQEDNINDNRRIVRNENRILRAFDDNIRLSSRRASQQLQVSKSKVLRVLHKNHRKAFHLQPVQNLHPGDAEKRLNFCQWLLNSVERTPDFHHKVLWTDEASFTRRGVVNYHNLHVWAQENPHEIRPKSFQQEFSVNVWLGVIDDTLCGPHFLPPRLNAVSFHEFISNNMVDILDDVNIDVRHESWIQLDGAPAHFGIVVREWLNQNYPEHWIGRLGPVAWPPRSPDITPLDFYVWGCLKDKVYAEPVATREELIARIQLACNEMRESRHQISAAVNSIIRRCRKCIEVGGEHFEQLLK